MRKEVLIIVFLFVFSAGVLAQNSDVSDDVDSFIKNFVEKSGVAKKSEISGVREINQIDLPEDVEIKEIDENKVGIYEVNYSIFNESKKIFVVTYASTQLPKKQSQVKNIQNLFFGFAGDLKESSFLESSNGVLLNANKGYVMLRKGSITGISTSLDLSGDGKVFVSVFKNGIDTGFGNVISANNLETIDYDLQSEGVVTYTPGDIISVYVWQSGKVSWGNVVTVVESTS